MIDDLRKLEHLLSRHRAGVVAAMLPLDDMIDVVRRARMTLLECKYICKLMDDAGVAVPNARKRGALLEQVRLVAGTPKIKRREYPVDADRDRRLRFKRFRPAGHVYSPGATAREAIRNTVNARSKRKSRPRDDGRTGA